MCGIAGIVSPDWTASELGSVLEGMCEAIRHRGPDDDGFFVKDGISLGMRRLSIIDLSGGKQPISNETGDVTIVYNGEVYNYVELMQQLTDRGHQFKTACDTEVIVHMYEERGESCVDMLRGMFAFAIWDERRQKLFIARDRLGIKPLYYTIQNGALIFSSEIKAILQHPMVEPEMSTQALSDFLSLKYVPSPQTMFKNIHSLPPGHVLIWDEDGVRTRRYWDIPYPASHNGRMREEEYTEQLEALLKESVRLRLRSDVPFGAFLSGGIDSSTVVALMSQILTEPVKTFSVGYDGDGEGFSELPYARMVATRFGTDHHEVLVRPQDFVTLAEKVVWHLDQPIADQAALATYMLSELAATKVKMVLTGEGGDELFAGYARYVGEKFAGLFHHIPRPVTNFALSVSKRIPGLRRPKVALYALSLPDDVARMTNWFALFNYEMKCALLTDELQEELPNLTADTVFAEHLDRTHATDWLNRMLYVDTKLWLPDDLLARGDKMTMAASIEGRVPLLDHKVVEFAATLPPDLKLKGLKRKYLLKEVARKLLPSEIITRKKQGFPMPISIWFRNEAREFVRDVLAADTVARRGLFKPAFVQNLLDDHESGFADHGSLLWALINIELWQQMYLDQKAAVRWPKFA